MKNWKHWIVGVLMCWGLSSGIAQAQIHDFHLTDGRSVRAEILSFNGKLNKVKLRIEKGGIKMVSPHIFTEEDQAFIREWATIQGFQKKSCLQVECKKKMTERWKKDESIYQYEYKRYIYAISLKNRNDFPLENIEVEYKIFYEQGKNNYTTKKVDITKNTESGTKEIAVIRPKSTLELKTSSIVLEKFEFNSSEYSIDGGNPQTSHGKIIGIWIRLRLHLPSGSTVCRDVSFPESIQKEYCF